MTLPPIPPTSSLDGQRGEITPTEASARLRNTIRARWLVRVRWAEVAALLIVVTVAVGLMGAVLPTRTLLSLTGLTALTNAWLAWRVRSDRQIPTSICGASLMFDIVVATVMLYVTGGPSNPFSVFYLVLITVSAVTLGSRWTWLLAVLAVSSYAGLFLVYVPLPAELHDHDGSNFSKHLRVMWIALTLAGALTTYFVTRLSRTIEKHEREIDLVRERSARHERVAALTTLAAGAAHELATPLATAMVAAGELERALTKRPAPDWAAIADDSHLIRGELDRCRQILDGMAGQAGDTIGERLEKISAREVVSEAIAVLDQFEGPRVDVVCDAPVPVLIAPRQALRGAIVSLVRNALQASAPSAHIAVSVTSDGCALRLAIRDTGCGMDQDVLARAGDPFFSTRPPGQGRGLGLFLARSLAERLGGRLLLDSAVGRGTTASLELPLSPQGGGQG